MKFDGKDYPEKGPRVTEGSTASGKRIDPRTIEVSNKVKGKLVSTERTELSEDGKTLTTTTSYPAVTEQQCRDTLAMFSMPGFPYEGGRAMENSGRLGNFCLVFAARKSLLRVRLQKS